MPNPPNNPPASVMLWSTRPGTDGGTETADQNSGLVDLHSRSRLPGRPWRRKAWESRPIGGGQPISAASSWRRAKPPNQPACVWPVCHPTPSPLLLWVAERAAQLSQLFEPALLTPNPTGGHPTPPIHACRIPPSKDEHLRTPGNANWHTHSACMPPHPPRFPSGLGEAM